jgi:hypothetical protein
VDLAFHHRLRMAIAKTLYPLLDTGWYAAQGKPYAKRYLDLCALLFIPAYQQLSLVKQQLDPSHKELKRERFLSDWEYPLDRYGKWTGVIRWSPGPKWFHDQEQRKLRPGQADRLDHASALPAPELPADPSLQPPLAPALPVTSSSLGQQQSVYTDLIVDFYAKLGQPRISRHKLEKDLQLLATLTDSQGQRFSSEDIAAAMAWIVAHKDERFAGKVYSLSLLPEVIGEALQGAEQRKKTVAEERRRQEEEEQLKAEHAQRQTLEVCYLSLPPAEQAALRERAVENLIQRGFSRAFLLETLVKGEVYKLLEERDAAQGTDQPQSESGGLGGEQATTEVADVCG